MTRARELPETSYRGARALKSSCVLLLGERFCGCRLKTSSLNSREGLVRRTIIWAAASAALVAAGSPAAWSYRCSPPSGGTCTCQGDSDCYDMRHSNVCSVSVDCSGSGSTQVCTCPGTRTGTGGGDTGEKGGPSKAPTTAPPATSVKPP
jgi:hypothetical protein